MRALDIVVHASTEPEPFGLGDCRSDGVRTSGDHNRLRWCRRADLGRARCARRGGRETLRALADAIERLANDRATCAASSANAREKRRAYDSRQRRNGRATGAGV